MNKYLEKLAELIELEPGVHYDLPRHSVKVTTKRSTQEVNRADRNNRLINGSIIGGQLGVAGSIFGSTRRSYPNFMSNFKSPRKIGGVVGGLLGAGVGGGLGALSAGLLPKEKSAVRDKFLSKMERRHEQRINELEGW